jgi:hypothetical protein
MQSHTPTVHCDGDEGSCGSWDVDYFEATASTVGGVRITSERRAPGWLTVRDEDFCPEHAPKTAGI